MASHLTLIDIRDRFDLDDAAERLIAADMLEEHGYADEAATLREPLDQLVAKTGVVIGMAIARDRLADDPEADSYKWDSDDMEPHADVLAAAGILPGGDAWDAVEAIAEREYRDAILAARPRHLLTMREEAGGRETRWIDADEIADEIAREWMADGDWGHDGASIYYSWTLANALGDFLDEGHGVVTIDPDHDYLIREACRGSGCGTDPDEHDWTSEGEGGCRENPGVWSTGGTSLRIASHCRTCGLHRTWHIVGSQHNPGECDTVSYEMPNRWCEECQSSGKCSCAKDDETDDE